MMNMIIHEDGHTNIENADALSNSEAWKRQKIREYFGRKFTLLLTNPPFGASIRENEKPYLAKYELGGKTKRRNRQKTEILFIERCLDFLKPGGRMSIVLPDGILTNSSLQYVRDFINESAQILGVISLPQTAFKRPASKGSGDTGSGVKASLLFLRKKKEGEKLPDDYPIFMSIAEHIGYDATGRPDKDEFPDILKAWQEFRKTNKIDFFVKAPLCFAIGRGKVEGNRIDSFYYKPEFRQNRAILGNIKYTLKTLEEISDLIVDAPHERPKFTDKGILCVMIENIKPLELSFDNRKYITFDYHQKLKQTQLKENDLLMVRIGVSTGITTTVPKDIEGSNISGNITRIVLKNENNPMYVATFLNCNLGYELTRQMVSNTARDFLTIGKIKSIKIPFPPRRIQDKIASIMDEAYRIKKEKEAEAERLLNSIESFVLQELGIKIPEIEEKSPKIFSVTADILKGRRLDPFYNEPKYKSIDEALRKGKYEQIEFGKIISEISGGATPKAKGKAYLERAGIPFLRVQNITEEGIKLDDVMYINEETHSKYLRRSRLKPNDLIFTITGRIGTVAVVPEDFGEGNINQHSVRIHLIEGVNEKYIASFFNTTLGKSLSLRGVSGGTRVALDYDAIKSITIPLPLLSVQKRIVNEVYKRREMINRLRGEVKELLEKAKKEVEKLILGVE